VLPTATTVSPHNPATVEIMYTNIGDIDFEVSPYVYDDGSHYDSPRPQFEYQGQTFSTIPDERKEFESFHLKVGESKTITITFKVTSDMENGTYKFSIGGVILDQDGSVVNFDETPFRLNVEGGTPPPTTPPSEPPRARIDILSSTGELQSEFEKGEQVVLDGSKSYDPDGGSLTFYWIDDTDGFLSDQSYFTMTTLSVGKHTITLTVTDDEGDTDTATAQITINEENLPPVANAGPDFTVGVNETFTLDASDSYDPDGTIVEYSWTFGPYPYSSKSGKVVTHSYYTAGEYTVTLRVTDNNGAVDEDTVVVTVGKSEPQLLITTISIPSILESNKEYEVKVAVKAQNSEIRNLWAELKTDSYYIDITTNPVIKCGNLDSNEEFIFSWNIKSINEGKTKIDMIFTGDNIEEKKIEGNVTIESTAPPSPGSDSVYIFPSDLYEKSEDKGVTDATCALSVYYFLLDKGYTIADSEDEAKIVILFGGPHVNSITQKINDITLSKGWGYKNNKIQVQGKPLTNQYDGIVGSLFFNNKVYILIYGNEASGTIAATKGFLENITGYTENENINMFNGDTIEILLQEYEKYSGDIIQKIDFLEEQTLQEDYKTITLVHDYFQKLTEMNYIKSNSVQDAFIKVVLSTIMDSLLDKAVDEVSNFLSTISITYMDEFLEYTQIESEYFVYVSFTHMVKTTEYSVKPEILEAVTESWLFDLFKNRVNSWVSNVTIGAKKDFMLSETMSTMYDKPEINFVDNQQWKEIVQKYKSRNQAGAQDTIKQVLTEFSCFEEIKTMSRALSVQQYPSMVMTALNCTDEELLRAIEILALERQRIKSHAYPGFWNEMNDLEFQYAQNRDTIAGEIQYFSTIEDIFNIAKGFQQILSVFCTLSAKYTLGATEIVSKVSSIANATQFEKIAGRAMTDDEKTMTAIVATFVGEQRAMVTMRILFCKEITARQISFINALPKASRAGRADVTLSLKKNNLRYGEATILSIKEEKINFSKRFIIYTLNTNDSQNFSKLFYIAENNEERFSTYSFGNLVLSPEIGLDLKPDDFEASKIFHSNGEHLTLSSFVEIFVGDSESSSGIWVALPTRSTTEEVTVIPYSQLDIIRTHDSGLNCNTFWGYDGVGFNQIVSYNLVVDLPLNPALDMGAVIHEVNPRNIGKFKRIFPLEWTATMVYMINEGALYFPIESYNVAVYDGSNLIHYIGLKDISGFGAFKISSFPEHIRSWKVATEEDAEFILGSPADLHVYDSEGRHVGINYKTGDIDLQIPGSYYEEFGDIVRIIIENAVDTYRVEIKGKEDGEYHLMVSQPVEVIMADGSTGISKINIPISSQIKKEETYVVEYDRDELSRKLTQEVSEIVGTLETTEIDEAAESRIIAEASKEIVDNIDTDKDGISDIEDTTPFIVKKGLPLYWALLIGLVLLGIVSYVGRRTIRKAITVKEPPTISRLPIESAVKVIVDDREYTVGDSVTVGRSESADIQISDPIVSRMHAKIYKDDTGQYWIKDTKSTHGTFIHKNGEYKKITKWALYDGDIIVLCHDPEGGKQFSITFKTVKKPQSMRARTQIEAEVIIEGESFPLTRKSMTIGRSDSADIQIDDSYQYVSRMHAKIYKDDTGQYWIKDTKSTHGTFIHKNGEYKKITKWALYDGDIIVVSRGSKGAYDLSMEFRKGSS
jgi:pSer/pThr/pTyr-binding forkhead associated (FHA) protein